MIVHRSGEFWSESLTSHDYINKGVIRKADDLTIYPRPKYPFQEVVNLLKMMWLKSCIFNRCNDFVGLIVFRAFDLINIILVQWDSSVLTGQVNSEHGCPS
jgi:hypothetical protein